MEYDWANDHVAYLGSASFRLFFPFLLTGELSRVSRAVKLRLVKVTLPEEKRWNNSAKVAL